MDFINLWPHDINELIFQHLTGVETLTATLVSQKWNEFLERSSTLTTLVLDFGEINRKVKKCRFYVFFRNNLIHSLSSYTGNP